MRALRLLRKRGPDAEKTPLTERREARFRFHERKRRASQARHGRPSPGRPRSTIASAPRFPALRSPRGGVDLREAEARGCWTTAYPAPQRTRAMLLGCLKFESVRRDERGRDLAYPSPARGGCSAAKRESGGDTFMVVPPPGSRVRALATLSPQRGRDVREGTLRLERHARLASLTSSSPTAQNPAAGRGAWKPLHTPSRFAAAHLPCPARRGTRARTAGPAAGIVVGVCEACET